VQRHDFNEDLLTIPFNGCDEKDHTEIMKHANKILIARKNQSFEGTNHQIIATDYSLDHWIAQNNSLDLNNMPQVFPDNGSCNIEVYKRLKDKYKNGMTYHPGSTKSAQFMHHPKPKKKHIPVHHQHHCEHTEQIP
jgi:hypothetical protein